MKLKYFLRGLGMGIILTALILCVSYRSGGPGKSVVEQARELGMVFPEGTQPPESIGETSPAPPSAAPAPVVGNETSSGAGVKGTETGTAATSVPSSSPAKPGETRKPTEPPMTSQPDTSADTGDTIRFKVRDGLLSSTVAREMKEAGIIQDDKAFDDYLERNGYSKKIIEGTYKIPKGASYRDLARIITRRG